MRVFLFLFFINFYACFSFSQVITTIAGTGLRGFVGSSEPATKAELNFPAGIAIDNRNDIIYFADQNNNRIRKINSKGIISTFAGGSESGYSGDGLLAVSAKLNSPTSVALDEFGNIYIADMGNNCIRKINKRGIISTFAGTGKEGYAGDGCNATASLLSSPISVATDRHGNVFIADQGNNRIRKVNKDFVMSTYAGTGKDGTGKSGLPATATDLSMPACVATDKWDNVYFVEPLAGLVRKIDFYGKVYTVAGNGSGSYHGDGVDAVSTSLFLPWYVAADDFGNIYIADQNNYRIRMVSASGIISTYAGRGRAGYSGDGGCATGAELGYPWGVTTDAKGDVYFSDWGLNCIRKVTNLPCDQMYNHDKKQFDISLRSSQDTIDITQVTPEDYTADVKIIDATKKVVFKGSLEFVSGKAMLTAINLTSGIFLVEIKDKSGKTEIDRVFLEN